jgi:hypothetical protein
MAVGRRDLHIHWTFDPYPSHSLAPSEPAQGRSQVLERREMTDKILSSLQIWYHVFVTFVSALCGEFP